MSYINDALKKAQKEKDSRYERFGGIITAGPEAPGLPRKKRLVIGVAVLSLVLISAGVLLTLYVPWSSSLVKRELTAPVTAGNPAVQAAAATPAGQAPTVSRESSATVKEAPALREAEALFQGALAAQRKGDLKGAETLYRKVLLLVPGHVQALNNCGVLYMGQKKRDPAIAMFSRAIVLKKDYVDPYYNLACLYAQAKEIDESLWYLKVAMTINGDVKNWVEKDADMKNIAASPAFKKLMEGQKN
jgi:tetratricopeptide (TPR) repeat protein